MTGSDSVSAFARSLSKTSMSSFSELAEPNCSMVKSGWAFCIAAVVASVASTRVLVCAAVPGTSKETCTECLSGEIRPLPACLAYGLFSLFASGSASMRFSRSRTTARYSGSFAFSVLLWMSTISPAPVVDSGKASSWIGLARPESPVAFCSMVWVPVPNGPPRMKAAMTTASQPKIAVLRCWALQRPARAAIALGLLTHLRTLLGRWLRARWAQRPVFRSRSHRSHPASGGTRSPGPVGRFSTRRGCG